MSHGGPRRRLTVERTPAAAPSAALAEPKNHLMHYRAGKRPTRGQWSNAKQGQGLFEKRQRVSGPLVAPLPSQPTGQVALVHSRTPVGSYSAARPPSCSRGLSLSSPWFRSAAFPAFGARSLRRHPHRRRRPTDGPPHRLDVELQRGADSRAAPAGCGTSLREVRLEPETLNSRGRTARPAPISSSRSRTTGTGTRRQVGRTTAPGLGGGRCVCHSRHGRAGRASLTGPGVRKGYWPRRDRAERQHRPLPRPARRPSVAAVRVDQGAGDHRGSGWLVGSAGASTAVAGTWLFRVRLAGRVESDRSAVGAGRRIPAAVVATKPARRPTGAAAAATDDHIEAVPRRAALQVSGERATCGPPRLTSRPRARRGRTRHACPAGQAWRGLGGRGRHGPARGLR